MTMRVLMRCDASPDIGYGHLMRCLAIAERMLAHADQVRFLIRDNPGAADVIGRAGVQARWLPGHATTQDVLEAIRVEVRQWAAVGGPVWVVVDTYEETASQTRCARESGACVAAVDDWGRIDHAAHLLINPNPEASPSWYPDANGTRLLLGPSYALVRREFQAIGRRDRSAQAKKVLVTLGGSDRHNRVMTVMQGLDALPLRWRASIDVDIVLGHGYRHGDQVQLRAKTAPYSCRVHRGVFGIAPLMAQADVAISAAGVTLYELSYLGIPTVALTLSDNQVRYAEAFGRRGAIVSLGMADHLSPESLASALEPVLADPARRRALSERAMTVCDGEGPERIRQAMAAYGAVRQVTDQPELLELMLDDAARAPAIYHATNYWAVYQERFLPELRRLGLHDFRRRRGSVLASFGATDLSPQCGADLFQNRLLHNKVMKHVPLWSGLLKAGNRVLRKLAPVTTPYNLGIESIQRLAYEFTRLTGMTAGAKPLEHCQTSLAGNPEEIIRAGQAIHTMHTLRAYLRYVYCSRFVNFDRVSVFVELGSGMGTQIEVLKQLYPNMCIVAFDLAPQLYVAEQYLKAVFPDDVVSYAQTRDMGDIPVEPGKIFLCGNWKFPMLEDMPIDLFWNAASLQEMEPDVVTHYLSLINRQAKAVYLLQAMSGQAMARKPGEHGVLRQTTLDDYRGALTRFELADLSPLLLPTGERFMTYHNSFWRRTQQAISAVGRPG